MATREQVTDAIKALEDNGNNTALEVRNTLTSLLEFTETVPEPLPGAAEVPFFHFWTEQGPIIEQGVFELWYSFKGIKGRTVNFTLRLLNSENLEGHFEVEIPEELSEILRKIVLKRDDDIPLDFAIPVLTQDAEEREKFHNGIMRVDVSRENELHLQIIVPKIQNKPYSVFTSVHFHVPEFKFDNRE